MNNSVNNGGQSAVCQQAFGSSPSLDSNQQTVQQNQETNMQTTSLGSAVDCTNPLNANSAKCKGDAPSSTAQDSASNLDSTAASASPSTTNFNTADANSLKHNQGMLFPPLDGKPQSASAQAPPGNSGGMIGGQASSSSTGFPTPASARTAGPPGSSKVTDILKPGERGGGGYIPILSNLIRGLASEVFDYKQPKAVQDDSKKWQGIDLKPYLLGGRNDPRGLRTAHSDILPTGVDIFEHVHAHYDVLCKLQRLFDCHRLTRPGE
jgi:hypothetical protein